MSMAAAWIALMPGIAAPAEPAPRPRDEEIVRSLDDQERVAALKRDAAALERLWSDQFTVNAPNNRVVTGKRAVMEIFLHSGVIRFSSFERQVEHIRVDGDFAFVMGGETVRPSADAPEAGLSAGRTVRRRFTNVWKRETGTWRLFARHANVIPEVTLTPRP